MLLCLVSLLASVIIWLQDFNNKGILNMSPAEREEVTKMLLPPTVSINTGDRRSSDDSNSNDEGRAASQVRNKYLKRIGVGGSGNGSGSDHEPLLQ